MEAEKRLDQAIEKYAEVWWGRALVVSVPYIGSAVDAVFTSRATELHRKRFEQFITELRDQYARLDERKVDKAFVESDEFVDLFITTAERVLRAGEAEKLEALRNAFVNATTVEGSGGPLKEIVIRVASDLTAAHMRFLRVVADREANFNADDAANSRDYTDLEQIGGQMLDITTIELEAIAHDLLGMGLVGDWWAGRWGGLEGKVGRFRLTPFGQKFLWFISSPEVEGDSP